MWWRSRFRCWFRRAGPSFPQFWIMPAIARTSRPNSGVLKPLLAYTDEAFPQADASLIVEKPGGVRSLLPGQTSFSTNIRIGCRTPNSRDWWPTGGNSRSAMFCETEWRRASLTAIFSLPLGSELAKRLSSAAGMEVDGCVAHTVSRAFAQPARTQYHRGQFHSWYIPAGSRCADGARTGKPAQWKTGLHIAFSPATQARLKMWHAWAAKWRTGFGLGPRFHLRSSFWTQRACGCASASGAISLHYRRSE